MYQLYYIALIKIVNFSHVRPVVPTTLHSSSEDYKLDVNHHDTLKSDTQNGILHRTGTSVIVNDGNDTQFERSKTSNG
jgi:hypothetical protein